jgi:single-strand DNA-binding protein
MSGLNQITIVGNVGAAPELSYGQNNQPYCRFSVAINEQWKSNGEKRERVTWFPVVAFNGLSENCAAYIERGRTVAVVGRVQTREYEDKEGTQHHIMQVIAEKVTFLGSARKEESTAPARPGKPAQQPETDDYDLPF